MKAAGIFKLYIGVLCDNGHDKGRHIGKLAFCHTQFKRTALYRISSRGFCRNLDRGGMDRGIGTIGYSRLCRSRRGGIPIWNGNWDGLAGPLSGLLRFSSLKYVSPMPLMLRLAKPPN